jgi:hypothetical protein
MTCVERRHGSSTVSTPQEKRRESEGYVRLDTKSCRSRTSATTAARDPLRTARDHPQLVAVQSLKVSALGARAVTVACGQHEASWFATSVPSPA